MFKITKNTKSDTIHLSDEDLLLLYKKELNISHFTSLFLRYHHLVFGVCLKYLKNKEEAEDMVMHIFEKLSNDITKYTIQYFPSWLHMVTKNACLMKLRKKSVLLESIDNLIDFVEFESFDHLNSEGNAFEEEKLKECIEKLKPEQKLCIELFYIKEQSYKEIEVGQGIDLLKVKSYIQNGKRNLKICLEK